MFLATYDIQGCLIEQIKLYFSNTSLEFNALKDLILSKKPVPEIYSTIATLLTQAKKHDQALVQKNLENQAYKKQISEDEQEKKNDQAQQIKDKELKTRYSQELRRIATQVDAYQSKINLADSKLEQLYLPQVIVTPSFPQQVLPRLASTTISHQLNEQQLRSNKHNYEIKIQFLYEKKRIIQEKLEEIEQRAIVREQREQERIARDRARINYQNTHEQIRKTLSLNNRSQLLKDSTQQHNILEKKCRSLIQNAEVLFFAVFIEQLTSQLSSMKLKPQEIEALNNMLKLIKQHIQHEENRGNTQELINKKKLLIAKQSQELSNYKVQLKLFTVQKPNLVAMTEQLTTSTTQHKKLLKENNKIRQRLGISIPLLLALTCLLSIPLILTLSGTIPFFIPPVYLYLLTTVPTAISFLATIAVGIAALIFNSKINVNNETIIKNNKLIVTNKQALGQNEEQLIVLQTITIPTLEQQINTDQLMQNQLELSLKKSVDGAAETLNQAEKITPLKYGSLLQKEGMYSESADTQELEQEQLSEAPAL